MFDWKCDEDFFNVINNYYFLEINNKRLMFLKWKKLINLIERKFSKINKYINWWILISVV